MKKIILSALLSLTALVINAQDSLYIYKGGTQTHKISISEIDSITFSSSVDTSKMEVTDVDGNIYKTVKIGNQVWMAENLRVSRYNDGTKLYNVEDNTVWGSIAGGAYCWYNNDSSTYNLKYGKLYNGYVMNNSKNICPAGWHKPLTTEIDELISFAGGTAVAGGKLKQVGHENWKFLNADASDDFGFSAVGSGYRQAGSYKSTEQFLFFGVEMGNSQPVAAYYSFESSSAGVSKSSFGPAGVTSLGCSIRCLKD